MFDVLIIGGGVIGGTLLRELAKYKVSACILEKENDVSCGATKANSGIIHGGFDPEPDTLKAKLNVAGVPLLYEAAKQLHVPHKNNGSMIAAFSQDQEPALNELYNRGIQNGVTDMELLSGDKAREMEPNLSEKITKVLWVPTAGIICPYQLTIAAIGNAMDNGGELKLNFEVAKIAANEEGFVVTAKSGETVEGKYIVNCAGAFADKIAQMVDDKFYDIIPRAGEYMLLDKLEGGLVKNTIFQVPTKEGKGILVTPTADGNLLIGPTASVVARGDSTETTPAGLNMVQTYAKMSVPSVNARQVITSFSGVRASTKGGDFIIEASRKVHGFVHAAAIDSPGLSSCMAIARMVVEILQKEGLNLIPNSQFNGNREDTHAFRNMDDVQKAEFIKEHPAYGKIVCRCETVSEGEIIDAIHRNPKPTDVDAIKRRTRSGMGRCQGGFCLPYVMKLLARENNQDINTVTKKGGASVFTDGKL